jgi:nucleotide-binding universal stress UspA family protein
VKYTAQQRVGAPGEVISKEAKAQSCDLIVMGTKGVGAAATLLGSVAQSTIEESSIPVMLVK